MRESSASNYYMRRGYLLNEIISIKHRDLVMRGWPHTWLSLTTNCPAGSGSGGGTTAKINCTRQCKEESEVEGVRRVMPTRGKGGIESKWKGGGRDISS